MAAIIDSLIQFVSERSGLAVAFGLLACAFIVTLCKIIDTAIYYRRRTNQRTQATTDTLTAIHRTVQRVNKQSADRAAVLRAQPEAPETRAHDAIAELKRIVDRQREYSNSIKQHRRNWEGQQRGLQARRPKRPIRPPQSSDLRSRAPSGDR